MKKITALAIALSLLPFSVAAQQLPKLPEQYYLESLEKTFKGMSRENQAAKAKNNLAKIRDGKDACLYIGQFSIKDHLKAKIYEADSRSVGNTEKFYDYFFYSLSTTQSAINFLCPQHRDEYDTVSDRMNKDGLLWIIQE